MTKVFIPAVARHTGSVKVRGSRVGHRESSERSVTLSRWQWERDMWAVVSLIRPLSMTDRGKEKWAGAPLSALSNLSWKKQHLRAPVHQVCAMLWIQPLLKGFLDSLFLLLNGYYAKYSVMYTVKYFNEGHRIFIKISSWKLRLIVGFFRCCAVIYAVALVNQCFIGM